MHACSALRGEASRLRAVWQHMKTIRMYVYIYIYIYVHIYAYIDTYISR